MAAAPSKRDCPSLDLVAVRSPEAAASFGSPPPTPSSTPQARCRVVATPQQTPRRPHQASPLGPHSDWLQQTPSSRGARVVQRGGTPDRSPQEAFPETPFASVQAFKLESTPQKLPDQKAVQIGLRTPKQECGQRACTSGMMKTPKGADKGRRSPAQEGTGAFLVFSPELKKKQRMTPPLGICTLQSKQEAEISEALRENSLTMLELALSAGGHGSGSGHPVYEAVRLQHFPALLFLLQSDAPSVDAQCCGRRPLHGAIRACRTSGDAGYRIAELLLQHGSKPNECEGDDCSLAPPLHCAVSQGIVPAVALLLRYGADASAADAKGFTPLHVLCQNTSAGVGGLLPPPVPQQPSLSGIFGGQAGDGGGMHAGVHLHGVICQRHLQVVELLLHRGASPVAVDQAGLTPVHYACEDRLRGKLARAARWWRRRTLLLVRGSGKDVDDSSQNARLYRALLPEVIEVVGGFL